MALAAAIIAGVIAAGTIAYGAIKQGKAKKEMRNAKRPVYHTPDAELENRDQLEYMAGQGLSDSSKQFYQQGAQRGLNTSIEAILKGGGDVNTVDRIYEKYLNNMGAMAVADDEARLKNAYALINERQRIADFQDKEFQYNQHGPYADKMQAAAQDKAYGQQLIMQGASSLGSAVTGYFGATQGKQKNTGNNAGGFNSSGMGSSSTSVGLNFQNYNRNSQNTNSFKAGNYMGADNTYKQGFNGSDNYTDYQKLVIGNLLGG